MRNQAGYTLIELVIVVAIVATVIASGIGMAMASRPSAVNAAAMRFDALIEEGRTIGRQFDTGATIVFSTRDPDGFTATLYRNRPSTLPLVATNTPVLVSTAAIVEQKTSSTPGFALAIHANGDIAMIPGYKLGVTGIAETTCPASHNYRFSISFAGHSAERVLPCAAVLATTGTPTFAPFPPAPTQTPGLPGTGCTNCTSIPLPTVTPSCPAGSFFVSALKCSAILPSPTPTAVTCPYGGTPPDCNAKVVPPSPQPSFSPPCRSDPQGYCWYAHSGGVSNVDCSNPDGWHTFAANGSSSFTIFNQASPTNPQTVSYNFGFVEPYNYGDDECPAADYWAPLSNGQPGDPAIIYTQDSDLVNTILNQLSLDGQGMQVPYCVDEQACETEWGYN